MSTISYTLQSLRLDLSPRSAENFPAPPYRSDELPIIRCITLTHKVRIRVWSTLKCKAGKTLPGISCHYSTSQPYSITFLGHAVRFHTPRAQRLLNPIESAYRSETGGLMQALRELNVEQSDGFLSSSHSDALTTSSSRLPQVLLRSSQLDSYCCRKALQRDKDTLVCRAE